MKKIIEKYFFKKKSIIFASKLLFIMSPDKIVCQCPCDGCLFHSVCFTDIEYIPFSEHSELCIDDNFCSRVVMPGLGEPVDKYLLDLLLTP